MENSNIKRDESGCAIELIDLAYKEAIQPIIREIPYVLLGPGQKFKFTAKQRKWRTFGKLISLRDSKVAIQKGHKDLLIFNGCDQQPMRPGEKVFVL